MYGDKDAIRVETEDLGDLVNAKPQDPVTTWLKRDRLTQEGFERLIFSLISSIAGYKNPEWLMRTNASDRGSNLSVYRVHKDELSEIIRLRAIIRYKHWQSKSVNLPVNAALKEQIKLWELPRVDVFVIATSGRFTADAVTVIEHNNQVDSALCI